METKKYISNEMKNVIKTSRDVKDINVNEVKDVRDFLGNRETPLVERKKELELLKQVISANKNIVSASITMLNCERLGVENEQSNKK